MGIKGDKNTGVSNNVAVQLEAKLTSIGAITTKKMFGGHGVFHEGKMFGIIDSQGCAFLKADDANKSVFEQAGSVKHSRMPYYSIPKEIFEDDTRLIQWAHTAITHSK